MKKLLIFLPVMFIVTLVFPNNLSLFSRYQAVQKEINLAMFTSNDYSYAAYNDSKASVEVIVSKINNNKATILKKTTFDALELKQYPSAAKAISNKMKFSGSVGSSDVLMVTYIVTYNTGGSLLKRYSNELISKETSVDNVKINI